MVAPRKTKKIFCTIVHVRTADNKAMNRMSLRPSDLVPWADPYISRLVTKLQSEVRRERQQQQQHPSRMADPSTMVELDPPNPSTEPNTDWDWEGADEPRWTYRDLPTTDFTE